ncbi:hypothetical protein Sjap_005191 [Stephania japonica]|uniref:Uncharacterized protein n=1 Tax=Stephania japonica TaxID=461633 RepID=A0AAP0K3L1_9MAGN
MELLWRSGSGRVTLTLCFFFVESVYYCLVWPLLRFAEYRFKDSYEPRPGVPKCKENLGPSQPCPLRYASWPLRSTLPLALVYLSLTTCCDSLFLARSTVRDIFLVFEGLELAVAGGVVGAEGLGDGGGGGSGAREADGEGGLGELLRVLLDAGGVGGEGLIVDGEVDEIKHFNWLKRKADAMREAAIKYRDLKRLASEVQSQMVKFAMDLDVYIVSSLIIVEDLVFPSELN